MLCPGVRGWEIGVVGKMNLLVLSRGAAEISFGVQVVCGDRAAGMVLGVHVVCVALSIRTGENLRGSLLGDRNLIATSFHDGGGVWTAAGSCGGDWIRFGDGEVPFIGRLGDGRGFVGGPRELRGLRGSVSDGDYLNRALDESGYTNLNCNI